MDILEETNEFLEAVADLIGEGGSSCKRGEVMVFGSCKPARRAKFIMRSGKYKAQERRKQIGGFKR